MHAIFGSLGPLDFSHAEEYLLHLVLQHELLVGVVGHLALEHLVFAFERLVIFLQLDHPVRVSQIRVHQNNQLYRLDKNKLIEIITLIKTIKSMKKAK